MLKVAGFLMLLSAAVFSGTAYAEGGKIGYVDVAKLFDNYQKTKDNDQVLQDLGKKKETEREKIVQGIRKQKDEIALLNNEDAKNKKQEQLDAKLRELEDFDRVAKRDLGQQRNNVVRDIFKSIDDSVQRYGERKGYDFIFNERALVYRNPKSDLTQDVLNELNAEYKKKR